LKLRDTYLKYASTFGFRRVLAKASIRPLVNSDEAVLKSEIL